MEQRGRKSSTRSPSSKTLRKSKLKYETENSRFENEHKLQNLNVPGGQTSEADALLANVATSAVELPSPTHLAPRSPDGGATSEQVEEWDYSATERWGWIILITTWFSFMAVMGSCLGIWNWAMDVGDFPPTSPRISDDDTLPIVGYYPALIVLTGVMSWIWVIVAWVGVKYFKHARIQGEET